MAGLDVEPQVVIRDEVGDVVARVDLAVRGTRVLIEFDGLVKYREGGSEALIAEKRREDELRRLGYVVVRFTWADLYRPERVVARVRAAVAAESSPLENMTVPSA
jgi:very-short-patch-repair endonuclease